jgi:uncharacterized protein (DUF1501 family)
MSMLSRRQTLAFGAGLLASTTLGGIPVALARATTERRFVLVVLRGALDGLSAVPPYFERDYRTLRGPLALSDSGAADGLLDLDGRFGLHPSLQPLHTLYKAREMAVVHAVATPYRARSHFDGQDLLESGADTPHGVQDGWLNRTLALLGANQPSVRLGLAVGQTVPLILRGPNPVSTWAPNEMPGIDPDFLDRLNALYAGDSLFGPALAEGLRAQAMSDEVLGQRAGTMSGEKMYGQGARGIVALRPAATAVGKLLAAQDGPRVAVLEMLGWDTHAGQNGRLAGVLRALGEGLDALRVSLGPAWKETAVAVVTEFGRTVAVNGTNGTDHGTGGVAFLLGGAIAGGRVITKWPGLTQTQLFEGRDLAPTTDLRSVMKALLIDHLGLPANGVERVVFPNSGVAPALRDCVNV